MQEKIYSTTIGGREVSVQIGKYCGQANGSCFVTCGDTVVMVNATMNKEPRPGQKARRSSFRRGNFKKSSN